MESPGQEYILKYRNHVDLTLAYARVSDPNSTKLCSSMVLLYILLAMASG